MLFGVFSTIDVTNLTMKKLIEILQLFWCFGCSFQNKKDSNSDIDVHILNGLSESIDKKITTPLNYVKRFLFKNLYRPWATISVFCYFTLPGIYLEILKLMSR